jgi:hypothetical protein
MAILTDDIRITMGYIRDPVTLHCDPWFSHLGNQTIALIVQYKTAK